jgi:hypothetical protein
MRCWPRSRRRTDRVVIIEDTRELQCAAQNIGRHADQGWRRDLSDLVRSSLRLRPDRIPIGEVRGAEALDLLKAWGTGHPGGIGTIHAGSGIGALRRLEQLIQEAVVTVPRALIAETIDLVAVLSGRGAARRLVELARVEGLGTDGDYRPPRNPASRPNKETRMIRTFARGHQRIATAATALTLSLMTGARRPTHPAPPCPGKRRCSPSSSRSRGRSPRSSR